MPSREIFRPLIFIVTHLTASMLWMSCTSTNHHSPPSNDPTENNQISLRHALKLAIDNVPEYFDLSQCTIEHFEMGEKYLVGASAEELEFYKNHWLFAFKRNIDAIGSVMFIYVDKRTGDITRKDPL